MRRGCAFLLILTAALLGAAAPVAASLLAVATPPALGVSPTGPAALPPLDLTCELSLVRLEPNTSNTLLLDTVPCTGWSATTPCPAPSCASPAQYPARPLHLLEPLRRGRPPGGRALRRGDRARPRQHEPVRAGRQAHRAPPQLYGYGRVHRPPRPPGAEHHVRRARGGNLSGTLWYRVYVPDRGRGIEGGVALPQVRASDRSRRAQRSTGAAAAPGAARRPPDRCARAIRRPRPPQLQEAFGAPTAAAGRPDHRRRATPAATPRAGTCSPTSRSPSRDILTDNAYTSPRTRPPTAAQVNNPSNPGIFANKDNAYVYAATSQGFGKVLIIRARAPTFASTATATRMPAGEQVRYFSMCEYEPAPACASSTAPATIRRPSAAAWPPTSSQRPSSGPPTPPPAAA